MTSTDVVLTEELAQPGIGWGDNGAGLGRRPGSHSAPLAAEPSASVPIPSISGDVRCGRGLLTERYQRMAAITIPASETTPETTGSRPFSAGIADPGPLGLGAFAMTTFFLSCVNAGFLPKSVEGVVLGLALFYGGIAQVLAGMWEFIKGNTFGAVAFTSYGAFWLSFWYLLAQVDLSAAEPGDAAKGIGVFLLAWTIFTGYMLVCAVRTNTLLVAVFGVLFLTFVFLTWGQFSGVTGITRIGGYLGLVTAVLAWYGSMAGVLNATAKHTVLPVFPRS